MTTLERIDHDLKEAMKSKDEVALSTLRMMRTALKNRQIEMRLPAEASAKAGHDLAESEVTAVLKTMIKQYQDALADFTSANRQDLVARQQKEIDLVGAYLPPAMPRDELERLVAEAVKNSGATDVGKAMGAAMKAVNGLADGNEVRQIVQKIIASRE